MEWINAKTTPPDHNGWIVAIVKFKDSNDTFTDVFCVDRSCNRYCEPTYGGTIDDDEIEYYINLPEKPKK